MSTFGLSKTEIDDLDKVQTALTDARTKLDAAVDKYNGALEDLANGIQEAIDEYNQSLEEARQVLADVVSQAEQDLSERSERWLEGDKGQAVQEWKDSIESLMNNDLNDVELELPGPIELDCEDHADLLGGIEPEPNC